MCKRYLLIIFILYIHCISFKKCDNSEIIEEEKDELVFAHVLFRHGDRTILLPTYPNDPYKDEEHWPDGIEQVTKTGKWRQYELGKYLRKRYYNLLGNGRYSPSKVYVESTNKDRALVSAAAHLAGLFPPDKDQIWTDELNWLPIPIHSKPWDMDYTLQPDPIPCPRYDRALQDAFNSPEVKAKLNQISEATMARVLENAGYDKGSMMEIFSVWSNSVIEQMENKTLPEWTNEVLDPNGPISIVCSTTFGILSQTTEMQKLKSGFLIREMLERFTQKVQSKLIPNRSLHIYSAHDLNVVNFLNSFGLYEPHVVPYAACVLFELYRSKDDFYVQIYYKNTTSDHLPPLNIPGCGTKCTLHEIFHLYRDVIPKYDFETECKLPSASVSVNNPDIAWNSDLIAPICCTIIVIISTICGWRK